MELVNIPRSCNDKFYRYKMPVMQVKIEGKGNGIRTVVTNMGKVMKALDRPMEYVAKFIAFELGTKSKIDDKQHSCTFAGKHDLETLANLLDKFITIYVLCVECGNPETVIKVKNEVIASKCKACGKVFKLENHKLSTFIINSNKNVSSKEKEVIKKVIVVEDEWSYDTSERAVMLRKQDLFGIENVYPADKFVLFIESNPPKNKVVGDLGRLKISQDWSDSALLKYVFRCLFTDMKRNFYRKVEYLEPYIQTEKDMLLLLMCIEAIVEENKCYDDIVHILNGFYDAELLEEDVIVKWFNNKSKVVTEEVDNKIKGKAKAFIHWLETADYDI